MTSVLGTVLTILLDFFKNFPKLNSSRLHNARIRYPIKICIKITNIPPNGCLSLASFLRQHFSQLSSKSGKNNHWGHFKTDIFKNYFISNFPVSILIFYKQSSFHNFFRNIAIIPKHSKQELRLKSMSSRKVSINS